MIVSSNAMCAHELARLGLSVEIIHGAIGAAEDDASSCTNRDPAVLPGFLRYARTVRYLRDRLIPLGWFRHSNKNFETIVHPHYTHALAVASGNQDTGIAEGTPRTRGSRGPMTTELVDAHHFVDELDLDIPKLGDERRLLAAQQRATWFLLLWRNAHAVRCELSLPAAVDSNAPIKSWRARLILPPLTLPSRGRRVACDQVPAFAGAAFSVRSGRR